MQDLFAYKLLSEDAFAQWRDSGLFEGSAVDLSDGYIHLSTRAHTAETAARHFAGVDPLMLVMVDLAVLAGTVRWEPSRGGALFPHVYGPIPASAIAGKSRLRLGEDGRHTFPAGF